MKSLFVSLILCLSALTAVAGPFDRGGRDDRRDDRGGFGRDDRRDDRGGGRGGREEWRQVDEVHFYDGKTAVAIQNCKNARAVDTRCTRSRDYQCGLCSENSHSDHSSYIVSQLIGGGGGGGWNPAPPPNNRRQFVQSYHFTDSKTAEAYNKCVRNRAAQRECSDSRNYECTPCTVESHTDHSQFDLYRLGR
jgi:hypothetical protein